MSEKGRDMPAQEVRILRLPEVMRLTGLSKGTIHRRYRDGTFPRPLRLGPQSIGWPRAEILEWLESLPRVGAALDGGRDRNRARGCPPEAVFNRFQAFPEVF